MSRDAAVEWPIEPDNPDIDGDAVLNGLTSAVFVIDEANKVLKLNTAAEHFFHASAANITGRGLSHLVPSDSALFGLIAQVRADNHAISEYDVTLETPRIGRHFVNIHAAPMVANAGIVILSMQSRLITDKIDRQLSHRGPARSVTAMASMLAHEVKNPLSGIRGAAQLLEDTASRQDQGLTRLIRDEVDRICALVDRMGMFAEDTPVRHDAVNIHQVLDHVLHISKNGFGKHTRFVTQFDPSLPAVRGDRDQLVQIFLNLVKNAVEAGRDDHHKVVLKTAYQHGVRFARPGSGARSGSRPGSAARIDLPLAITITDNGVGIPDDIKPHLFDPFVTSKPQGSGLGLALVAKIVGDHEGVIECESENGWTVFRIMLPIIYRATGPAP